MYYRFAGTENPGEGAGIHEIAHDVADAPKWRDKRSPGCGDDGDIPSAQGFDQASPNEASGPEDEDCIAICLDAHPINSLYMSA